MHSDQSFRDSDSQFRSFEETDISKMFPLSIISAGYVADPSRSCADSGSESGVIFLYTTAGEGILHQKGKSIPLPADSCCLIDCRAEYSYEVLSRKEGWCYHYLNFNGSGLFSYAPHLLQSPECLYPPKPDRILEICRFFLQTLPEEPSLPAAESCLLLQELLNSLLDLVLHAPSGKSSGPGGQSALSPAFAYIRKHYARPLSVEELAQSCHLSKYYFLHLFKESCGETPYQYLSRYRIDVAKRLLADKNIPLQNIAAMVGYPTYANFLTQFKKYVNTPPEYSERTSARKSVPGLNGHGDSARRRTLCTF